MNAARYAVVPAAMPAQLPAITRDQGIKLANAIWRKFKPGRSSYWARRWCIEGRRVWVSTEPTANGNHSKGLGRLVHDLSHEIFSAVYPSRRNHDPLHAEYERQVAAFVAARIDRFVKPPVVPPMLTAAERRMRTYSRNNVALHRWDAKLRRAQKAIRKLRTAQRRIERALIADANVLEATADIRE